MTPLPPPTTTLTPDEARRIILKAQGLLGTPDRRSGVRGTLRHLGAVQLDTISVLARSHELIPYARLGAVGRKTVESAYWTPTTPTTPPHAFEYWSHAACILPIEEWPHFAFRRRAYRNRPHWNHTLPDGVYDQVIKQLRTEGPLTATELGGAKKTSDWWDWSGTKVAVERALMYGEVVCVDRKSWKRVYDLAERAIPADLLHDDLSDRECVRRLVRLAGEALGVGTRSDIADYHRLRADQVDEVIEDSGLTPVTVTGWGKPAWADPKALETPPRGRHRTTLLSPFDSLIWERARTERVFGVTHRLEAYVPKPKRVHGYFAMPVLAGGRLVGRVDPAREGTTLVAKQVSLDGPKAVPAVAQALVEAASWVDCTDIRVERVTPQDLQDPLAQETRRALTAALR
ncbi:winged helix-turn-helix domain-containing protein [Streptomyces acidiscabies]|uniref:Crosslink repair DNA glycosylase YcaQ family protein n=1 Tax=Streptomyces acidiscabies TaxID=42234 RepID=A0AAP6B790_9ACTN|nr:crosslink repair DNA glycosylase YcaQ family protein [Streptomyces acidiscabies]MBP5939249.1 winged helix-turn-helix domain-containing protein [Streptomyces sp. LBUM 1476]MBZ3910379.1 YcaQ family DNA glycosylase [Streptomyces acidiscabies]MDX2959379.1 crosslink repair DNA glycosylase YcaQ family protein [Streptomyces acidiscabies]MDX3019333.1 crosslink repair DNA glycosylase YcaQ family protein [Streptomyces acidiscabies]MDX3790586.1 crosslink repair DNA glycosylase YcaQ family protein [Str